MTSTHQISVALIVEPFVKTQAGIEPRDLQPSQRAMVLDWLWTDYYGKEKYRNVWFQWEGKPLVIAFDPMTLTLPLSSTYPISYTIRNWTGRPKSDETVRAGWDWFFGPPQDPISGMSSDGVTFVYPRFDEVPAKAMGATYITWPPRSIDPLLRRCAYERQWQQLAEHRADIKMIVLYGWNLYGEQAYIEPAAATPPRPSIGYSYVDRTREYYQALADGRAILPASYCPYLPVVTAAAPRRVRWSHNVPGQSPGCDSFRTTCPKQDGTPPPNSAGSVKVGQITDNQEKVCKS